MINNESTVVWAVERNFNGHWRYFAYPGEWDENDVFQIAWDLALKFYDRNGAEQCCIGFPDDWDIRITDHQLVPPSPTDEQLIKQLEEAGFRHHCEDDYLWVACNGMDVRVNCDFEPPRVEIIKHEDDPEIFPIPCKDLASAVRLGLTLCEVVK